MELDQSFRGMELIDLAIEVQELRQQVEGVHGGKPAT
jgi:hypothetical protein